LETSQTWMIGGALLQSGDVHAHAAYVAVAVVVVVVVAAAA
jgi:hypothetical protein